MTVTIDGSTSVTINSGAVLGLTPGTAVASTSGTSIDFTSIPSWVKRITVMFSGVSTSGVSTLQIQIGAGSVASTGYISTAVNTTSGGTVSITSGFLIIASPSATDTLYGSVVINALGSNIWTSTGSLQQSTSGRLSASAGGVTLSGTLDRLRITTVNGTDTFDAGSINIIYE